jgi:uncharacterized protein YecE (DUF72 family)
LTVQNSTKFYIGTAGWSYKDWEGIVYQKGGTHLSELAQWFNTVEVNVTFYRMISPDLTQKWCEQTRKYSEFKFLIKVNQLLTHDLNPSPSTINEFKALLEPLRITRKLGGLLFQFPWRFKNNAENREYLANLFSHFDGYPKAVEFRHASWNNQEILTLLTDLQIAFTNIDQPVIGKSLSRTLYYTAQLAYFRYHGRNRANWFSEKAGRDQRYDYLYDETELADFKDEIQKIQQQIHSVYVIFNNHFKGQAVVNALQLANLLTGQMFTLPSSLCQRYPVLKSISDSSGQNQTQLDLF